MENIDHIFAIPMIFGAIPMTAILIWIGIRQEDKR